jgi:hypothetical protein
MGSKLRNSVQNRLAEAQTLIDKAKLAYEKNEKSLAESLCRESLQKLRESHLLESTEPLHRQRLHDVGRMVHDTFGCNLEFHDGSYWVTCPVMLSHNQVGFSIGGSARVICSICGEDNMICPHVKGRTYDRVIANRWLGFCSICLERECHHISGEIHDGVEAFGIITDLKLDHISLVTNPSNPLCVIEKHSLSEPDLLPLLPEVGRESFVYGETVVECHHCKMCSG